VTVLTVDVRLAVVMLIVAGVGVCGVVAQDASSIRSG
jgi:hypothetical protein